MIKKQFYKKKKKRSKKLDNVKTQNSQIFETYRLLRNVIDNTY